MKLRDLTRVFLCALALLFGVSVLARPLDKPAIAPAAQAETSWSPIEEDWGIMEIGGSRIGWSNTTVDQGGDSFRTTSKSQVKINRGPVAVEIQLDSVFIEKADGTPVSLQFIQKTGTQAIETTWEFKGDKVREVSRVGGRETVRERSAPAETWMPVHKAKQFVRQQQRDGATEFTYKTIDPQSGIKVITVTSKAAGQGEYEMDGEQVPVQIWKTTTEIMPESTEYYTTEGDVVYQETPTSFGNIVLRRASKDQAMQDVAGGNLELMERTFIKPSKPIENSMKAKTATLKLLAKSGTLPELPSAGAQRVTMADDRKSAILEININENLPATSGEIGDDNYTQSSTMVDFEDALVTKLSEGAMGETTPMEKAVKLRDIAHDRISRKGMATAFACASETARTRTGDCSEHGVLLCALLRAQDIPARVALGLVYADQFMKDKNIFGWHMWTQALIDGKWVDLDATLPVSYSAAHILTGTSSLADGLGAQDMASIITLIGNMDVEVIEVGYD